MHPLCFNNSMEHYELLIQEAQHCEYISNFTEVLFGAPPAQHVMHVYIGVALSR